MEKSKRAEIQKEYNRIHKSWLDLHFKTSAALLLLSFGVEAILGWMICNSDLLNTTIPIFILKFFIAPASVNLLLILISFYVMKSERLSQEFKVYTVSIVFVLMCFVLFTVHIAFPSLYFFFAIPIVMTTVYADYRLTLITSGACLALVTISQLLIKWDIDKVSVFDSFNRLGDFIISIVILLAFSAACMVVIRFERAKNEASVLKEMDRNQLRLKLQMDELTGIFNRKALQNALRDMEEDETGTNYAFVMIDLDHFKALNDRHGHLMGDQCLIEFGNILNECCGDAMPCRYGGDEFSILFSNCKMDEVIGTCRRIQKNMESLCVGDYGELPVTASFGIAEYVKEMDMAQLIYCADQALYEAKVSKNAISVYQGGMRQMGKKQA